MLQKIEELAGVMVKADAGSLRIAFNEADSTRDKELEAQEFLKVNESRLGRDFKLYAFMARVGSKQDTTIHLLGELVLPLKSQAPQAYVAGLDYLAGQASIFGNDSQEWVALVNSFKPKAP